VTFAAIATVDTLEDFFEPIDPLVDECKVHLNDDGLRVQAVDPANVAMGDLRLDADAFESYEVRIDDDDADAVIGINLERFLDVVGFGDSGELVHLQLNQATRKLDVQVGSIEYTLALIDPDSIRQEPDLPDLDLNAEIAIEGGDLGQAVDAAELVSDHVTFGVDAGDGVFYAEADGDTDDVHVVHEREDLIDLEIGGGARSLYSLDYVSDLSGAIDSDAEVTIELGDQYPFIWHYSVAEGHGQVTYLLAPRIQSE
jgi:proliferating cell nuclear antigen